MSAAICMILCTPAGPQTSTAAQQRTIVDLRRCKLAYILQHCGMTCAILLCKVIVQLKINCGHLESRSRIACDVHGGTEQLQREDDTCMRRRLRG